MDFIFKLFANDLGGTLMSHLTATDTAMLLAAFNIELTGAERKIFLDPTRDIDACTREVALMRSRGSSP
jgi:hypothetical protein